MSKLTAHKKELFLEALAGNGGNVTRACELNNLKRTIMYQLRDKDDAFREAWDQAVSVGRNVLEDVAIDRALDKSDTLLIFMLKGAFPEKYKERSSVDMNHPALEELLLEGRKRVKGRDNGGN
jgi:hypothetical protein